MTKIVSSGAASVASSARAAPLATSVATRTRIWRGKRFKVTPRDRVTEREQSGRTVFRVRLGPFDKKEDAEKAKERLDSSGVETALVRVQR